MKILLTQEDIKKAIILYLKQKFKEYDFELDNVTFKDDIVNHDGVETNLNYLRAEAEVEEF